MTIKTKWIITISTSAIVIASAAVATTVLLHKHKDKVKQPAKVSEPVKKVINLPIPVDRVRTDLINMHFTPERVNLMIESYTRGEVDIYKFYEQLENEA